MTDVVSCSDCAILMNDARAKIAAVDHKLTAHIATTAKCLNDLDARLTALEAAKAEAETAPEDEHECFDCRFEDLDECQHPCLLCVNGTINGWQPMPATPELPVVTENKLRPDEAYYCLIDHVGWVVRIWNATTKNWYEPGFYVSKYSEIRGPIQPPR